MLRKGGEAGRTAVRHAGRTGPRDTHRKAARYSASPIGGSRPPVKAMLTLKPTPGPAPTCVDERACVTDSTDWGPDGGLTRRPVLGPRRRVSRPQGPTAERPRPHGTRGSARLAWGGCGAARSARGPAAVPVARAGGDNQGTSGRGRPPQPFPGVRPSGGWTRPRRSPCPSAGHAPRAPAPGRRPHLVGGAAAREEVAVVVAVQRDVEDARVAVEGLLGPVAVVHILTAGRSRH